MFALVDSHWTDLMADLETLADEVDDDKIALILDLEPPLPLPLGGPPGWTRRWKEGTSLTRTPRARAHLSRARWRLRAQRSGPGCGEVSLAPSAGRPGAGPASPQDWRPAAPPGHPEAGGKPARESRLSAGAARAASQSLEEQPSERGAGRVPRLGPSFFKTQSEDLAPPSTRVCPECWRGSGYGSVSPVRQELEPGSKSPDAGGLRGWVGRPAPPRGPGVADWGATRVLGRSELICRPSSGRYSGSGCRFFPRKLVSNAFHHSPRKKSRSSRETRGPTRRGGCLFSLGRWTRDPRPGCALYSQSHFRSQVLMPQIFTPHKVVL